MKINRNYHDFIILGAGISGLGAGIALNKKGKDSLIIEKDSSPGGLNKNLTISGCDFDYGPKILLLDHTQNSNEILSFLGDNFEKYPVVERTYLSRYGLLGFPLQRFLVELPNEERIKIISDLKNTKTTNLKPKNFRDWLINGFGEYFCNLVLFNYEEKKWQINLDEMDYKWALNRPIKISYNEIIKGSKQRLPPDKYYYYPKSGNISTLTNSMAKVAGSMLLDTNVLKINLKEKFIETNKGRFYFNHLISTLPLDYVVSVTNNLPRKLNIEAKKKLKRLSILVYNFVFRGDFNLDGTAIYFPEKKYIFRRISILQNLCPALKRDGLNPISIELSISNEDISQSEVNKIYQNILSDFSKINWLKKLGKPIDSKVVKIDFAYPFQLNGLSKTVSKIKKYYENFNIYHCGRGGNFDYCNSDQAYKQGKETAQKLLLKNIYEK